jgi:hypothetical protein
VASYLLQQVNKVHRQGRNYDGQGKSTERKELPNKKEEIKSKPFMLSLAQAAGARYVQDQGRNQGMVGTCKTKEEGMVVSPLDLWNHWGIQILLLLSLCLQVLLHPLIRVR